MIRKATILALLLLAGIEGYSQLYINEILAANASVNYDRDFFNFPSWVEIYNCGKDTVHLKKYFLTDDPAKPDRWSFPDINLLPGNYLLVWADKNNTGLHASFSLDAKGEFIGLYDSMKKPVDTISFGKQYPDVSFGRTIQDSSVWKFYGTPTPGKVNSKQAATSFAPVPSFSLAGGYYSVFQKLTLVCGSPSAKIYYTTNGSEPDEKDSLYKSAIDILYTTAIRARTYDSGYIPSAIITKTYFINDHASLPVFSIVMSPSFLSDDSIGIYTVGKNGVKGYQTIANYNQPWERAASIEFYENTDQLTFQTNCGVEIYGNASRNLPQKSLDIKIKDKYGNGKINYQLFKNRPYDNIHSFILRNSGNDWSDNAITGGSGTGLMFRDGMIHTFVNGQMDVDFMSYRPALLFINGMFLGITDLREKNDSYYCQNLFSAVDKDSVTILKQAGADNFEVMDGDDILIKRFIDTLKTKNLSDSSVYAWVKDSVDIREFINYIIVETFSDNIDWPSNNVKLWRQKGVVKWRWMLIDLDFGFNGIGSITTNTLNFVNNIGNTRPNSSVFLFRLMKNNDFKNEFAQTYAAHLNITYAPKRIHYIIDSIADLVRPEVLRHVSRWMYDGGIQSLPSWESKVLLAHTFANDRPAIQWSQLKSFLGYNDMANVCIRKSDPGKGMVYVQGATLCDSFNIGPYFNHIPVELKAVPRTGYYFIWWEIKKNGKVTHNKKPLITDTINSSGEDDTTFYTAVFHKSPTDTSAPPPLIFPVQPPPPPPTVQQISRSGVRLPDIYPNPAAEEIHITFPDAFVGTMSISDLAGKILLTKEVLSDNIKINIKEFSPGIYIVIFRNNERCLMKKFIKN